MEFEASNISSSFSRHHFQPVRVFLVDDDLCYLTEAQRTLASFGCLVKCFDSAKFAKRELNKAKGKVDIVFTDVYTRGMDGFELLDKIKERWINLPVVVMTADSNPVIVRRAMQQKATFFANKCDADNVLRNFACYVNWVRKAIDQVDNIVMDGWNEMRLIERKGRKTREKDIYWSPVLRNKFFYAVNKLTFARVVPISIMEEMKEPGLTREQINSHLQKYRMFIKKVTEDIEKINQKISYQINIPQVANTISIINVHDSGQQTHRDIGLQQAASSPVPFGRAAQVTTNIINAGTPIPPPSMIIGSTFPELYGSCNNIYNSTCIGENSGVYNSIHNFGESSGGPYNSNINVGGSSSGLEIGNHHTEFLQNIADHNNFSPCMENIIAYAPVGHDQDGSYMGFQITTDHNAFSSGLNMGNASAPALEAVPFGNNDKYYNVVAPRNKTWETFQDPPCHSRWSGSTSLTPQNMMTSTSALLGESSSTHHNECSTTMGVEVTNHGLDIGQSSCDSHNPTREASFDRSHADYNLESSGNSMGMTPDPVSDAPGNLTFDDSFDDLLDESNIAKLDAILASEEFAQWLS